MSSIAAFFSSFTSTVYADSKEEPTEVEEKVEPEAEEEEEEPEDVCVMTLALVVLGTNITILSCYSIIAPTRYPWWVQGVRQVRCCCQTLWTLSGEGPIRTGIQGRGLRWGIVRIYLDLTCDCLLNVVLPLLGVCFNFIWLTMTTLTDCSLFYARYLNPLVQYVIIFSYFLDLFWPYRLLYSMMHCIDVRVVLA